MSGVTVILHVRRSSGAIETHALRADGDHVALPLGLLEGDDVVGFDVEVPGTARDDLELGGCAPRAPGGVRDARG